MMDPEQAAREFLDKHPTLGHMADGSYTTDVHDSTIDSHVVNHLPGVEEEDIDKNPYHMVTISKDITASDGAIINKVVKLEVDSDNKVQNVIESK